MEKFLYGKTALEEKNAQMSIKEKILLKAEFLIV